MYLRSRDKLPLSRAEPATRDYSRLSCGIGYAARTPCQDCSRHRRRAQIGDEIVEVVVGHSRITLESHRRLELGAVLALTPQNGVTFRYKDYRADGRARYKLMTLATDEFIRRFLSHVLPKGFHRIRPPQ